MHMAAELLARSIMQIRSTFDVYMLSKLQPLRDQGQLHNEGYMRDMSIHSLEESCKVWQSLLQSIFGVI